MRTGIIPILMAALPAALIAGCDDKPPALDDVDASLPMQMGADEPSSCVECHPRQVAEWLGSSHNYGSGLDATFQALELAANYYAAHLAGGPRFRQNQICVSCHAPTLGLFNDEGVFDINATVREGLRQDDDRIGRLAGFGRELPYPADSEDLLMPIGRAIEVAMDGDQVASAAQRNLTFQGISCDTCHKVGAPYDDRFTETGRAGHRTCEEPDADPGTAAYDEQLQVCLDGQYEDCESSPDPRCFRRSRQQDPHAPPVFDLYVASCALPVEREGPVRYGPFAEGDAVPATAHGVSNGSTPLARAFDLAIYPDGTEFPDQPRDIRPFIQSSHFCGTCHDVRIPPLGEGPAIAARRTAQATDPGIRSEAPRNVALEPVHNEPFLRLENLYTEWYTSALNLHPDARGEGEIEWPENPYRNPDGTAKRIVCQDCHMSLYPYAPPGTYPGATTHPEECDEAGHCGLQIATQGAASELRIRPRERVTTHNMTGVDIALGRLVPVEVDLDGRGAASALPNQEGAAVDEVYGLPLTVDERRKQMLRNAAAISLAGTPRVLALDDPNNCDDDRCNLPVKVWLTNVNGGHNVAAGFSQERQIWVEFTIQDLGRRSPKGTPEVVDCDHASIDDFYESEADAQGYPERRVFSRTLAEANDLMNRMAGIVPPQALPAGADPSDVHGRICRGMSGHLIDKPHPETHELGVSAGQGRIVGDGRLDDEDILLHRIGNTLPSFDNGTADPADDIELLSWHTVDLGFDAAALEPPPTLAACRDARGVDVDVDSRRVRRADQFHVVGLDAFDCQLSEDHLDPLLVSAGNLSAVTIDGRSIALGDLGALNEAVTATSDERLEILYPFPEFPPLLPHYDPDGEFHFGERFGLVYPTNIFYQTCECAEGDCEGPEEIPVTFSGLRDARMQPLPQIDYDERGRRLPAGTHVLHAQMPWVKTYPTLPHHDGSANHHPLDPGDGSTPAAYLDLLAALADDPKIVTAGCGADGSSGAGCGTTYREAFTFVPLNADHMPNNRSLRMYRPQRHYYDIRVPRDAVGPLRVSVKLWFRHFPPEFLRILARFSDAAYKRACGEGKADYFPHGPLVVEGEASTANFPNAANIDRLKRVLLDQAVVLIDLNEARPIPERPTWQDDVAPIIRDNCLPCHSDVLRHGGLILGYDDHQRLDPVFDGVSPQDPVANLLRASARGPLVVPGEPRRSPFYLVLTESHSNLRAAGVSSRPMPLGTDPLSAREVQIIERWITQLSADAAAR